MAKTTSKKARPHKPVTKPKKKQKTSGKALSKADRQRQIHFRLALAGVLFLALCLLLYKSFTSKSPGKAVNLTDSVLQYQSQVEEYCAKYDITAFSQVVLAIMQQESAGTVSDVMQASESPFNQWYSHEPGSITDPDYSIQVGVETFAYCLEEADCTSPNDLDGLFLALQNYNYGNSYATWALENYGGYTKENALEFSENMKYRLGWSKYGDPEYVEHVLQYYRP